MLGARRLVVVAVFCVCVVGSGARRNPPVSLAGLFLSRRICRMVSSVLKLLLLLLVASAAAFLHDAVAAPEEARRRCCCCCCCFFFCFCCCCCGNVVDRRFWLILLLLRGICRNKRVIIIFFGRRTMMIFLIDYKFLVGIMLTVLVQQPLSSSPGSMPTSCCLSLVVVEPYSVFILSFLPFFFCIGIDIRYHISYTRFRFSFQSPKICAVTLSRTYT